MEFRLVTVVLMTIMALSTLLALCVPETEARPSRSTVGLPPADGWTEYYRIMQGVDERRRSVIVNECETSPEVRGLCQRCAKATKSKMAYPLCCEHRLESRRFCVNFLNFGLTNRNDLINS